MASKISQADLDPLAFAQLLELADAAGFDVDALRAQPETDKRRAKLIKIILDENLDTSLLPPPEDDEEDEPESKRARPSDDAEVEQPEDMEVQVKVEEDVDEPEEEEEIEGLPEVNGKPTLTQLLMNQKLCNSTFKKHGLWKRSLLMNPQSRNKGIFPNCHKAVDVLLKNPHMYEDDKPPMLPLYLKFMQMREQQKQSGLSFPMFLKSRILSEMVNAKSQSATPDVPAPVPVPVAQPMIPAPTVDVNTALSEAQAAGLSAPEAMMVDESDSESERSEKEVEAEVVDMEMEEPVVDLVERAGGDRGVQGALLGEKDIADVLDLIEEVEQEEPVTNLSETQKKIMRCLGLIE